jgi:thiol-disulfide isomerase/thioredoxin
MKFKSINNTTPNKEHELKELVNSVKKGNKVFILVHKEGCPPCMATRPKWLELKKKLSNKNDNVFVVDVEEQYINGLDPSELSKPNVQGDTNLKPYIGDIDGFPTMKLITNNGNTQETYENSKVLKKDRSLNSFAEWIESNINDLPLSNKKPSSPHDLLSRLSQSHGSYSNKKNKKTKRKQKMTGGRKKNNKKNKTKKIKRKNNKIKYLYY